MNYLQQKAGLAPFTKLIVRRFDFFAYSLEALVRWPKRLEELKITCNPPNWPSEDEDAFLATKCHLSILIWKSFEELFRFTEAPFDCFNLRDFPNLETLRLGKEMVVAPQMLNKRVYQSPENLLAPRLRMFEWDFEMVGEGFERTIDFKKEEEAGLREFVRKAVEQGCPLETL